MTKLTVKPILSDLFLLFAAVCALGVTSTAKATGGKDGGGGNICWRSSQASLLELADLPTTSKGDQLKQTELTETLGIDLLAARPLRSFRLAQELIEHAPQLKSSSRLALRQALESIRFYMVDFVSDESLRAAPLTFIRCDRVTAAAIYKWLGVVLISINDFNHLDSKSQAGLFIHEALRLLQVTFALDLADSDLQGLTRALVLGDAGAINRTTAQWPDLLMRDPVPANLELNSLGTTRLYSAIGLVDDLNRRTLAERKAVLRANWQSFRDIVESAVKNPNEDFKK